MNLSLDDFKFGANILIDMRNPPTQIIGEFQGYTAEKQAICVGKANWQGDTSCGTLIIKCENIVKISVEDVEKLPESSSSIAKCSKNPLTNIVKASNASNFNWIAGNKSLLAKTTATPMLQMQQFCNKLFSNCNFTKLLHQISNENEEKIYINLPTYYAQFFREPKLFFEQQKYTKPEKDLQNQSLALVKEHELDADDVSLELSMCTLNISMADNNHEFEPSNFRIAKNTESLALDLSDHMENLNMNSHDCDASIYELVEVDLSHLKLQNSVPQIKIGNLIFKSYAQALTEGSMEAADCNSLMED